MIRFWARGVPPVLCSSLKWNVSRPAMAVPDRSNAACGLIGVGVGIGAALVGAPVTSAPSGLLQDRPTDRITTNRLMYARRVAIGAMPSVLGLLD